MEGITFKQNIVYLSKAIIVKTIDFESMYLLYITLLNANLAMIMLFYFQSTVIIATCHHFIIFFYYCFCATNFTSNFQNRRKNCFFHLVMNTNLWEMCLKCGLLLISFRVSSITFFFYVPFFFFIHLLEEKLWIPLKEDQLFEGGQM